MVTGSVLGNPLVFNPREGHREAATPGRELPEGSGEASPGSEAAVSTRVTDSLYAGKGEGLPQSSADGGNAQTGSAEGRAEERGPTPGAGRRGRSQADTLPSQGWGAGGGVR